ncbi:MAG: hypothetical protein ACK2UY_03485, partial [Anaerolineae bacterium]
MEKSQGVQRALAPVSGAVLVERRRIVIRRKQGRRERGCALSSLVVRKRAGRLLWRLLGVAVGGLEVDKNEVDLGQGFDG